MTRAIQRPSLVEKCAHNVVCNWKHSSTDECVLRDHFGNMSPSQTDTGEHGRFHFASVPDEGQEQERQGNQSKSTIGKRHYVKMADEFSYSDSAYHQLAVADKTQSVCTDFSSSLVMLNSHPQSFDARGHAAPGVRSPIEPEECRLVVPQKLEVAAAG